MKRTGALAVGVTNVAKKPKLLDAYFAKPASTDADDSKPKPTPGESTVTPQFDKTAWIAGLTETQRDTLKLEIDTLDGSWLSVLHGELTKPYFLGLKKFLKEEKEKSKTIYPAEEDIYSWSKLTPLDSVKVVVLGQDPYHGPNQAHGLCFSVKPPTQPPPSLKNIFVALQKDYPDTKHGMTGLLTPWAKQGILLLNTCLTVERGMPQSHANHGWETFTSKVIEVVGKSRVGGICFLVWGTPAAKRVQGINSVRHLILRSVHPSPLSASRGFFDCGHFKKANEWLMEKYGDAGPVDWRLG